MKRICYLIILLFVFQSCEKEERMVEYFPLNIGNYWVYGHYWAATGTEGTEPFPTDSITIKRDTFINGLKYYVFEGSEYFNGGELKIKNIVRDSLGYIVNAKGDIIFSATNFTDILHNAAFTIEFSQDTLAIISYKMEKPSYRVNVPAGNFNVLNYKGTVTQNNAFTPSMEDMMNKAANTYYAPNVGKIQDAYLLFNPKEIIKIQSGKLILKG